LSRTRRYLGPETIVLYDSSLSRAPEIADQVVGLQSYDTIAPEAFAERSGYHTESPEPKPYGRRLLAIPAADLARKKLHPRVFNMIILGAIIALTKAVSLELVQEALEEKLERRFEADPDLKEHNFQALELGYGLVAEPVEAGR
jgi:2-oxoglutarate ferredoxin oxidoreductase subunit gamma